MEANFMRVQEVAEYMDISVPMAYKIIRRLNEELSNKGYLTVSGRVNRNFFIAKVSGNLPA
jgi:Mn-dependent DtxR family transcriptional regulator